MSELKIDTKAIEKRIDEIPGVCGDAKKAIKKIFEDGFGVEFKKRASYSDFPVGGVFRYDNGDFVKSNDKTRGVFKIDGHYKIDTSYSSFWEEQTKLGNCVLIANSPEEYFHKKFKGKL